MGELFLLPAGLVLFLYGIRVLGEGLKDFLRVRLRGILSLCEKRRIFALLFGALLSIGVQSSGGAVSLLASMINAGLLSFSRSMDIMIGASLGNTLTTQIIAFRVAEYAPYILALGYFIMLLSRGRLRGIGTLLWGLGLVFFSMLLMEWSFLKVKGIANLSLFRSSLLLFLLGASLTMIFQSSALILGLTISLISGGVLSLKEAFFIVLGTHLGSSFTIFLASLGMRREAQALAWVSLLYRALGTVLSLLSFPLLFSFGSIFSPERGVAMLHLSVALLNALPFLFFRLPLGELSLKLAFLKEEARELNQPAFLDEGALEVPEWACSLALKESLRVGTFLEYQLLLFSGLLLEGKGKPSDLKEVGEAIERLTEIISSYLARVGDVAEEKLKIYTFLGEIRQASALILESYLSLLNLGFDRASSVERDKLEAFLDSLNELLKASLGAFALSDKFMAKKALAKKKKIEESLKKALVEERLIDKPGWLEFATFAKRLSDQCYYIIEMV